MIWVLGATLEVEVSLASMGYFRDMNWLDRAATKVFIIGQDLASELVSEQGSSSSRAKEAAVASVTKEEAATYVVVYSRVFVRDHPSIDGKYVGALHAKEQALKGRKVSRARFLSSGDLFEGTEAGKR